MYEFHRANFKSPNPIIHMMTSKIRACFDNDVDFLVRAIEASGDCFYECVSIALQEGREKEEDRGDGENNTTVLQVRDLRRIVADSLDASKLDELRMLASSGLEDYSFVFEIWDHDCCGAKRKRKRRKKEKMMEKSEFATLRVVKDRLMRSGKTTGPQGCVWADEWAMQVLSANLGITLLFVNEEVRCGNGRFVMIAPSDRLGVSGRGETKKKKKKKKRVYSSGEQTTAILLQRTRRQHINIISYRKQFLVDVNVLPSHVTRKWSALGRCLSATGTTSTPNTEDDNRKETETSLPLDDFSTRIASSKDLESLVSLINTAYESEKVKLPHIKRTNEEEISKILHESNDREFLLVALKRDTLELAGCVLVRDVSKDTAYFGTNRYGVYRLLRMYAPWHRLRLHELRSFTKLTPPLSKTATRTHIHTHTHRYVERAPCVP